MRLPKAAVTRMGAALFSKSRETNGRGRGMAGKSKSFAGAMQDLQVAWREESGFVESKQWGWQNGRQYPWILPSEQWEQGLWPGIRSQSSNSLPAYLGTEIQAHQGKHNLKSSWVLCANLYFPFRATAAGRTLLAGFLREYVSSNVETLDELHLEYAEDGNLDPAHLLGETGGKRGSGQTSPDLAFHVNGHRGLILIESKLTEHTFYPCSARRTTDSEERPGNPDPSRCLHIQSVLADTTGQCHQCLWGRKYWEILRPVANEEALRVLTCCPAAIAGYQLFRQQALAEGIAASGKYDFVYTCVALDSRNAELRGCLASTGISDLEAGWSVLFNKEAKARFKVFTHQAWVAWVGEHGATAQWGAWLDYVRDRYGYASSARQGDRT